MISAEALKWGGYWQQLQYDPYSKMCYMYNSSTPLTVASPRSLTMDMTKWQTNGKSTIV
jgi:hypothetical protein